VNGKSIYSLPYSDTVGSVTGGAGGLWRLVPLMPVVFFSNNWRKKNEGNSGPRGKQPLID